MNYFDIALQELDEAGSPANKRKAGRERKNRRIAQGVYKNGPNSVAQNGGTPVDPYHPATQTDSEPAPIKDKSEAPASEPKRAYHGPYYQAPETKSAGLSTGAKVGFGVGAAALGAAGARAVYNHKVHGDALHDIHALQKKHAERKALKAAANESVYHDVASAECVNESNAGDLAEAKRNLTEARLRLYDLQREEKAVSARLRAAKELGKDTAPYQYELGRLRSEIIAARRDVARYQAQVDRYQAEYNEEHRPEIEAKAQRRRDHELAMQRQRDAAALERQKQHDSNDAVNMRRQKRNSAIKGAVAGAVVGAGAKAAYDYYKKKKAANESVYAAVAAEQRSEE